MDGAKINSELRVWQHSLVTPVLGKLRQEDDEFKASLGSISGPLLKEQNKLRVPISSMWLNLWLILCPCGPLPSSWDAFLHLTWSLCISSTSPYCTVGDAALVLLFKSIFPLLSSLGSLPGSLRAEWPGFLLCLITLSVMVVHFLDD